MALLPGARLCRPIQKVDLIPAAHRPVPPAGTASRLQYRAFVSKRSQFVRRNQPCNASSKHHHRGALAGTRRRLQRNGRTRICFYQTQSLHRQEGGAIPSSLAHARQEITSRNPHGSQPSKSKKHVSIAIATKRTVTSIRLIASRRSTGSGVSSRGSIEGLLAVL